MSDLGLSRPSPQAQYLVSRLFAASRPEGFLHQWLTLSVKARDCGATLTSAGAQHPGVVGVMPLWRLTKSSSVSRLNISPTLHTAILQGPTMNDGSLIHTKLATAQRADWIHCHSIAQCSSGSSSSGSGSSSSSDAIARGMVYKGWSDIIGKPLPFLLALCPFGSNRH